MASSMERSLLGKGNDFVDEDEQLCQSCSVSGKSVAAKTFCVDCREYYCQQCTDHHKTLTLTKNHALVKADEAKKAPAIAAKDKCSKKCSEHTDKSVNYFCVAHSQLGCSVCVTLGHKQCQDVEHIPTAAKTLKDHPGFNKFDGDLENLETAYKTTITDIQNSIKLVQADENQVQQVFRDFRKQMNDALNKMESQATAEAKKIKDNETKKSDALIKKLEKSQATVDALAKELRLLLSNGKNSDAYVLAKTDAPKLTSLQEELTRTTGGQTFQRFQFEPSVDLLKVGALGKLNTRTGGPVSNWSVPSSKSPVSAQAAPASNAPVSAPTTVPNTKSDKYCMEMALRIKKGDRVRRGRDWVDGNTDGGSGALGTVVDTRFMGGAKYCIMRWDNGNTGDYMMSASSNIYHLEIV